MARGALNEMRLVASSGSMGSGRARLTALSTPGARCPKVKEFLTRARGKMYIPHVFLRSIALFPANAGKSKGASIALAMLEVVKNIPAYAAIVERAIHRDEMSFTAVEVAAHWHEHFRNVASPSERALNDQAVCFFQVAQGPGLGTLILGRKGAPTRFEFSDEGKNKFADIAPMTSGLLAPADTVDEEDDGANDGAVFTPPASTPAAWAFNNKAFITHAKNIKC